MGSSKFQKVLQNGFVPKVFHYGCPTEMVFFVLQQIIFELFLANIKNLAHVLEHSHQNILKGKIFVAKHETSEVAQVNDRDLSVVRNISQRHFKGLLKVFCSSVISSSWHQCNRHSLWCSDFSGPVRTGNRIEIYVCINSC